MIRLQRGTMLKIEHDEPGIARCEVRLKGGAVRPALAYQRFLGAMPEPGDQVVINTTAADMQLGTGGLDFVVACIPRSGSKHGGAEGEPTGAARVHSWRLRRLGHVMKLKYTPLQTPVMSVEAPESPYHEVMRRATDASGLVVVAAELHSQAALAARVLHRLAAADVTNSQGIRVAYLWPAGGALVASFSRQLRALRDTHAIVGVVTCGEALGGDLEAVNLHSGLLAARHVLKADVCVAAIGPGVVGTDTAFGTTALVQGDVLNAALDLGAHAVAVARLSYAEPRERHRGLSHHTITVLTRLLHRSVTLALPRLSGTAERHLQEQLVRTGLGVRHELEYYEVGCTRDAADTPPRVTSMGRGYDDDPAFFEAVASAAAAALQGLRKRDGGGDTGG